MLLPECSWKALDAADEHQVLCHSELLPDRVVLRAHAQVFALLFQVDLVERLAEDLGTAF